MTPNITEDNLYPINKCSKEQRDMFRRGEENRKLITVKEVRDNRLRSKQQGDQRG